MALVVNTRATAEETLTADVRDLGPQWLADRGVGRENLELAQLGPRELFRLGWATTPEAVRDLGLDALTFYQQPTYAAEAAALYGADACRACWLRSAGDALALAGGAVCREWGVTLAMLLRACPEAPLEAQAVLSQTAGVGLAVRGVHAETLVATGIDGEGLLRGGVRLNDVMGAGATPAQLTAMGYTAFTLM